MIQKGEKMKQIDFTVNNYKGYSDIVPKNKDLTAECDFKKSNFIYGANGSGKSTFANYQSENYDAIVFNRNYISDNIYLKETSEFIGVKMISGKKNVEIEKRSNHLPKTMPN